MSNPTLTDRHRECANEIMTRAYEGTYSGGIQFNLIAVAKLLAEKFPEPSPTTEPLYRIKPLEWEETARLTYSAKPAGATYFIYGLDGWMWRHSRLMEWQQCNSLEDGKAKCEAHYKAFLAQALEEVKL